MKNILLFTLLLIIACKPSESKKLTAQEIINKAIVASGTDKISNSTITFTFRDKSYKANRNNGLYKLEREFTKDSSTIKDVVSNDGFKRFLDDNLVEVADSMKVRYSNSVNSVHYFSVLPFGLNDKAVHKKLLASSTIHKKEYYKIQITFSEENGGEDFDDVFVYWIGKQDFLVDYLAYSYHTNEGGMRFRELTEQCVKQGIRFLDYANYKPLVSVVSLENLDKAFEDDTLKKVSEIILRNIEVTLN